MGNNKEPKQDEVQINQQYVEELIYENMRLLELSIRLMFENRKLREELRELKALERWWRGEGKKDETKYLN
jgi:hypothetical protein